MIEGHGDDAYKYEGITSDFSSNICAHVSHQGLLNHLAAHPELIDHYPEPEAWSLEKMIAERHGIEPGQVLVTSGATEAIYLIARAFPLRPTIPEPTFSEYADAYRHASLSHLPSSILWLCNPNNPTGKVYDQLFIDRMMAEHELVVLDQSYELYTDAPVMSPRWGCRTPYCLQIHSMTKNYGVPGLRLGYITGHASLLDQARRHMHPWSVSALAIEAGKYLLGHDELLCRPDLEEAARLGERLRGIGGIEVMPTQTNFMLCQLKHRNASELKEYLAKEHHILIRDASNFRGLTPQHFRIAAQTATENDALADAIADFVTTDGHA
ncbi:MAG: aminotransferase class I/II-fold pyridoxal phosphate-dependent enzyme [Bacteroidaceae bacterium]|nr:aminotransferase class I/II-fold pyridoxal phosphate-dependent enzyme [Bacteroidaceae bacterium]